MSEAFKAPVIDVPARFQHMEIFLRDGRHLVVKIDPNKATDMLNAWQATRGVTGGADPLFQIPVPDEPWQEFYLCATAVLYMRSLDDAHAQTAIDADKKAHEIAQMEFAEREAQARGTSTLANTKLVRVGGQVARS